MRSTRRPADRPAADPGSPTPRRPDRERSRQDILAAARAEFAEHGLSGARVDAIAARMHTTKRMIYYYFGSKAGLYLAVLEQAYGDIRAMERKLDLESLEPVEAVRRIVESTFDYDEAHADFIRLVSIENIHHGKYVAQSETIRDLNASALETLTAILRRGRDQGVFRAEIEAIDLHLMIGALCFFRVSNRHTFGTLFGCDLSEPGRRARHKRMICEAVIRLLQRDESKPEAVPARAARRRG